MFDCPHRLAHATNFFADQIFVCPFLTLSYRDSMLTLVHFFVLSDSFHCINYIGGVMIVNVLASSAIDCGFELSWVESKTIKSIFVASPLRMHHKGERSNII